MRREFVHLTTPSPQAGSGEMVETTVAAVNVAKNSYSRRAANANRSR